MPGTRTAQGAGRKVEETGSEMRRRRQYAANGSAWPRGGEVFRGSIISTINYSDVGVGGGEVHFIL